MQIKINDATDNFLNVKYIQPIIYNQYNKRQSLVKNNYKKSLQYKINDIDENNSYENIINRIMEPERKNKKLKKINENIKIIKEKKEISPTKFLRRKSEIKNHNFFGDKNRKLPKNIFNLNHKTKPTITNLHELNLSSNSGQISNKNEYEQINEVNIFEKVEKENVINFAIESNHNYSKQLNNGNSVFLVTNQIVNINKKDFNIINENQIDIIKSDLCIQTDPWITENINQIKFTIKDNHKKKKFLCCF
jgi:hypothetical protein